MKVITRTLRRRPDGSLEEKGIDVSLAVDLVSGAVDGAFDVGVVVSTDTDLLPALEFVIARPSLHVSVEVAAWKDHSNAPLSVKGQHVWCHRLTAEDYHSVKDKTVYVQESSREHH